MTNVNPLWEDNSIQFPRLIAELLASDTFTFNIEDLKESMDLEEEDILELFDRAQGEWDGYLELQRPYNREETRESAARAAEVYVRQTGTESE